jgi:two-component system, OmpR family, response regulator
MTYPGNDNDTLLAAQTPNAQVVIADDDPDTLELFVEALRILRVQLHSASSGAELVVLLADHGPFDLIVTDIDMPWMEGLGVIRSARAAQIETPVLFVSGVDRPDLSAAVTALGDAQILRKPVTVATLRDVVRELLLDWPSRRLRQQRLLAARRAAPPTGPE